jgi:cell division protein DivIC
MSKKGLKQAKKRLMLEILVFLVLLVFLSFSMFKVWLQIIDNKSNIVSLNEKYEKLLEEEKALKSDVNKLQDPDYVARYAREKYLYSKEGEFILQIPEEK